MNPYPASPAEIPMRPAPRRPLWRRTVFWAFLVMLAILAVQRFPSEVSYWYLASAEIAAEQGDIEKALNLVKQAAHWASQEPLVYQTRANILAYAGQPAEALAAIDDALQRDLNDRARFVLLRYRSVLNKEEGRYEESLRDFDAAAEIMPNSRPSFERAELLIALKSNDDAMQEVKEAGAQRGSWVLIGAKLYWMPLTAIQQDNQFAYFSALLGKNLDDALTRAEAAVAASDGQDAAVLDTRGFIHFRRGDYDAALADLSKAVELTDDWAQKTDQPSVDRRMKNSILRSVAVIHYHRALVLSALKKPDEAEKDLARVRDLGFEPGEQLF